MVGRTRRVDRYVDALLSDRRPPRRAPSRDDLDAITAAIELASARPQAGMPDPRFVERLERQLREQVQGELERPAVSRRGLLHAGALAAALAAGVVTDHLVTRETQSAGTAAELAVDGGRWHPVAAPDAVPVGRAVRCSTGAVEGVVVNRGGEFHALVAICSHLGCTLRVDGARLRCPCGPAQFGLDGEVLVHTPTQRLRPLSRIPTRLRDGMVEVQVV